MVKMTEEDPDYEGPWATKDNSMTIDNLREHLRLGGMCAAIDDVRSLMAAHDALAERAAAADRDYADMRRFQARFIEADHARLALIVDVQRLIDAAKSVWDSAVAHDRVLNRHTKVSPVALDCLRAALDALEGM